MPIETVLLAVGRDDDARMKRMAEAATDLAATTGARVVVAHAFESQRAVDDALDRLDSEGGSADDVTRRLESVRVARTELQAADVEFEVRGVVGEPGQAISDLAGEIGADRVIVGGRRRSPTGKAVFGSTAQEILLSAPCPVTFVRE
ncbi:universal stress protein [Halorarum halobium]|uniref:universal stress protein n=1 Tax=Halorarum halobium TaxID=3075121 RepID=UPI0028B06637|nr:universal stress protein [Halobaculum sp. XH14]